MQHPTDIGNFISCFSKGHTEEIHGQAKNRICNFKLPKGRSACWPARCNLEMCPFHKMSRKKDVKDMSHFLELLQRDKREATQSGLKSIAADYPSSPQGYNLSIRIQHTNFFKVSSFLALLGTYYAKKYTQPTSLNKNLQLKKSSWTDTVKDLCIIGCIESLVCSSYSKEYVAFLSLT